MESQIKQPDTLKDLKKIMRKASTDRTSKVFGMFATPNTWGPFQFTSNPKEWNGRMSVLETGRDSVQIKIIRANEFLNPLGWEMIDLPSLQRNVVVQKIEAK